MPPKRGAKAGLPKKRAKLGAVMSSISRAAPGRVMPGSLIPALGRPSPQSRLPRATVAQGDHQMGDEDNHRINEADPLTKTNDTPLTIPGQTAGSLPPIPVSPDIAPPGGNISVGTFCHFCLDACAPPHQHECVECGAIICEQFAPRSSGCIYLETVDVEKDKFLCPICSRTGPRKDSPLSYLYIGFGRRKKAKMLWPMAIINLTLQSMNDNYLASTVQLEVENHYRPSPRNLFVSTLQMRAGRHVSECRKLAPGVNFVLRSTNAGFPPNAFIILDTHSDEYSGMLQHTGGHAGGFSTSIREILIAYLGEEFGDAMKEASAAARKDDTVRKTISGKLPWCNLTARSRGGWTGVFMVSCGPAIRVTHHFEEVKALVASNLVDFVLAFGGSGTLPSMISGFVRSLLLEIAVFGVTDVWSALCHVLATNNDLLDYTTVVLVYAVMSGEDRVLECRQVTKDIPGLRAFGYEFKSCGTPGCHPTSADLRVYNRDSKVHLRCLKCHWRSAPVSTDEDNKHFKRVDKTLSPMLFWHYYPPSTDLQNFFVEKTAIRPDVEVPASSQTAKGNVGHDKKGKGKQKNLAADVKEDLEMARYRPDSAFLMEISD